MKPVSLRDLIDQTLQPFEGISVSKAIHDDNIDASSRKMEDFTIARHPS